MIHRFLRGAVLATAAAVVAVLAPPTADAQTLDDYTRATAGTRTLEFPNGLTIKMFLDEANLGTDALEVAEITFPVGMAPPRGHQHGATEIFYVVEGVLGHVVNGTEHRLEPGMVGVVKPGDEVIHRVLGDEPVKALVLWVPGGEADRISPREEWEEIEE